MKKVLFKDLFSEISKHIVKSKALSPREFAQFRRLFTTAKSERSSGYMNVDKFLSAYMSFYLPVHLPELFWILEQNRIRLNLLDRKWDSILDIGSGPGTATLSSLMWLLNHNQKIPSEIKVMDQSKKALMLASTLIKLLTPAQVSMYKSHINKKSLSDFGGRQFDLLLVSHFLNELGSGPSRRHLKEEFMESLGDLLSPGGLAVIVEPPLREPTMDLMRLRDDIQQGALGDFKVLAPCPNFSDFCPLMKEKKGWCYSQPKRQDMPKWMTSLDFEVGRMADINLTHPGFSYLVIGNPKFYQNEATLKNPHKILNSDRNAPHSLLCNGDDLEKKYKVMKEQRGAYIYEPIKEKKLVKNISGKLRD